MFIELHILQSFGPTNLNRDEDGNPKDCEFGGVRRARISSQCLKRAIRRSPSFAQTTQMDNGIRTKRIARRIHDELVKRGVTSEEAVTLANSFAEKYPAKDKTSKDDVFNLTNVLVYFSQEEIDQVVSGLMERKPIETLVKDLMKATKGRSSAPDVALFGRFLAELPIMNLDGALQVAHAISTHRVDAEYDFFTAVDDLRPQDTQGAGMMGSIGYNSACYYRYSRLDWNLLLRNLGDVDLARYTVAAFLQASIDANPTGMQNSHDNQSAPTLVMAVVRQKGGGWSLVNSFEAPVRSGFEGGFITSSVERLVDSYQCLVENLGDLTDKTFILALQPGLNLKGLSSCQITGRQAWADAIQQTLPIA